jgi:hypothetical protein
MEPFSLQHIHYSLYVYVCGCSGRAAEEVSEGKVSHRRMDGQMEGDAKDIVMKQKDLTLRKAGTGVVLDSQMPTLFYSDFDRKGKLTLAQTTLAMINKIQH